FLLGRPALAGTIFNEEPLAVDVLLGFDNKVVPLDKRR
ncbi:EAL domain-containing protein, partial [Mesorhizobium sp. M00.F.Ca.ET.158.01.1.1]